MNAHPIPLEPMCVHPMRWMIFSTPVIGLRQMTSIPPMDRLANASTLVTTKALYRIFFIAITPFVAVFVFIFMLYCPYITNITHEINFCQYIYVFVCKWVATQYDMYLYEFWVWCCNNSPHPMCIILPRLSFFLAPVCRSAF